MQNIALGAFGYELTHSAFYVALLGFAQLGPLLLLSIFSGVLADSPNSTATVSAVPTSTAGQTKVTRVSDVKSTGTY